VVVYKYLRKKETMKRQRPSIMVNKIDNDKLTKVLISKRGKDDIEAESMVVVNTHKGLATICHEGVGWWKNDEEKYLTAGYVGFNNIVYYLTEDELLSCLSSEQVDLAEFINTFGDRLETNFDLWYSQVRKVSQDISAFDFA
jgi:hypothetical protein